MLAYKKLSLNGNNRKRGLAVIAALVFLWLAFALSTNPLGAHGLPYFEKGRPTAYYYSHENFDINSVMLTRSPIIYSILDLEDPANGLAFRPLGWKDASPDNFRDYDVARAIDKEDEVQIYLSSFHLQGHIWSCIAQVLGLSVEKFETTLRLISCGLTALVLTFILVWYWRELTPLALVSGAIIIPMAVGIVLTAPNLFRVPWITLLPLAISLWTYRCSSGLHFTAISLAMLVSFLCSLEFASNIAVTASLPVVYFGLLAGDSYVRIFGNAFKYAGAAIVAFGIAMTLTALKVDGLTGGDPGGFQHLLSRAGTWTVGGILEQAEPDVGVLSGVIKIAGATGLALYKGLALPNIIVILIGLALAIFSASLNTKRSGCGMSKTRAWAFTTIYALLGSLSWIVLQFHHVALHPRFAPFLLFYPFIICLIGLIGLVFRDLTSPRGVQEPLAIRGG